MTTTSPSDITVTWSDFQFSKWRADGRSQSVPYKQKYLSKISMWSMSYFDGKNTFTGKPQFHVDSDATTFFYLQLLIDFTWVRNNFYQRLSQQLVTHQDSISWSIAYLANWSNFCFHTYMKDCFCIPKTLKLVGNLLLTYSTCT